MPQTPSDGPDDHRESDDAFGDLFPPTRRQHRELLEQQEREQAPPVSRVEQMRRAYGLTALGTIFPGAGLAMTKRRTVGLVLLGMAIGILLLAAWWLFSNGPIQALAGLGSRPARLQAIAWLAAGGMVIWMGSVALTAIVSSPKPLQGSQRAGLSVFTGLMCLVLAVPTAVGLRYADASSDTVGTMFANTDQSTLDLGADDPWEDTPRVNVLLLGSDAGDGRTGVRTDTMLVASIDTQTGDSVLFGIPRNLENVPIPEDNPLSNLYPDGYNCGDECLMNAIWTEAENAKLNNPGWYPDDPDDNVGLTATREVISEVLGIPVDYSAVVNLEGFTDLVDAMGGVDINVQERLPMGGKTVNGQLVPDSESGWLEVGEQHLDGYEAMWYSRSRVTTDDFSRMRRQRCVVSALVEQVNPFTILTNYTDILDVAGQNIYTSIPQEELPAWAELVLRVQGGGQITSLPFTIENTNVSNPDFDDLHEQVQEAIAPPEPTTTATTATTPSEPTTSEPTTTEPTADETTTEELNTDDELVDVGTVC